MRAYVWLQPNARTSGPAGRRGDELRLRVQAPPEGGRANEALCELFAQLLDVPKREVRLVAGHTSRRKLLEFPDAGAAAFWTLLRSSERSD